MYKYKVMTQESIKSISLSDPYEMVYHYIPTSRKISNLFDIKSKFKSLHKKLYETFKIVF